MLHEFLNDNREELINRCLRKTALRSLPRELKGIDLQHGIPLFIDQLARALESEGTPHLVAGRRVASPACSVKQILPEIGETAARHGHELWRQGFSVEQVVHGYGDLCQSIAELAFELDADLKVEEFGTLNWCLDNAIADAVTEFNSQRDVVQVKSAADEVRERLGFLAHELRNLLHTATLAIESVRSGDGMLSGPSGDILDTSMVGLRSLIDRTLADVRLKSRAPARLETIAVAEFVAEVAASAALEARIRGCKFTVSAVDPRLAVEVDRDLLASALGNLLQNAFKFTEPHTAVSLDVYASADLVFIDVADHCSGLPDDALERMFVPFEQTGSDRSGLGLGLSICRRSVVENGGVLSVHDYPGRGCVFTIQLPKREWPVEAGQASECATEQMNGGESA